MIMLRTGLIEAKRKLGNPYLVEVKKSNQKFFFYYDFMFTTITKLSSLNITSFHLNHKIVIVKNRKCKDTNSKSNLRKPLKRYYNPELDGDSYIKKCVYVYEVRLR